MRKLYFVLIGFVAFAISAPAQQKIMNGYLKDSLTQLPIANGIITNTTTKKTIRTDADGFFHLPVTNNDLIYAIAKDYRFDTLRYALLFSDTVTILLPPSGNILENVTVASGYNQYKMDSLLRRKDFEEARGQTYSAIEKRHTSGFGLIINLDRFTKNKYKHKKDEDRTFNAIERQDYIDSRFSPQLVAFYTGLKGGVLLDFMQHYQPEYNWLRQHPAREQLIDYISDKMKNYKSRNH